jgi:septal ring factor EnvC (AmiA/AmiB activator)
MDMQELANRMDASVQAMLAAQSRDLTEATLIRTAASLLDKLNDRDLQIRALRHQVDVMAKELSELRQRFTDDGK